MHSVTSKSMDTRERVVMDVILCRNVIFVYSAITLVVFASRDTSFDPVPTNDP